MGYGLGPGPLWTLRDFKRMLLAIAVLLGAWLAVGVVVGAVVVGILFAVGVLP